MNDSTRRTAIGLLLASAVSLTGVDAVASPSEAQRSARDRCQDVFRPLRPARPGHDPISMATGDFNADRRPDVAVMRRGGNVTTVNLTTLTVLLGNGDGRLRVAGPVIATGEAGEALVGEFTGDAHLDLLVVPQDRPGIRLLIGDGAGGFTSRDQPFGFGRYARARAVADFNGDGRSDVVVDAPRESAPGAGFGSDLHVLLGDGGGSFAEAPGGPVALAGPLMDLAVGEFNRDGHVDLAAGLNYAQDDVLPILLGDGRGGFRSTSDAVRWRGTRGLRSFGLLRAGDLNADGTTDLVAALQGTSNLHVLIGNGGGRFADRIVKRVGQPAASITIGNFNRDRLDDVAVSAYTAAPELGSVSVLLSDKGGGVYEAPGSPERPGSILFGLTAVDFNSDGYDDLGMLDVPTAGSGTLPILLNSAGRPRRGDRVPIRTDQPLVGTRLPYGSRFRLPASIACEPGARQGRRLTLRRRLATHAGGYGPWRRVAVKRTSRRGTVIAGDRPTANAQYRWVRSDRRRPVLKAAPVVTVRVLQTVRVRITGDRIRGKVRPAHPGAAVVLQRSNGEGQDEEVWTAVARARLTGASTFSFAVPARSGAYRVCRPADRAHASGVSQEFGPGGLFSLRSRVAAIPTRCFGPYDP